MNENAEVAITASLVKDNQRLKFLPKHFGNQFMVGESLVYQWADRLSSGYDGGLWAFYELSNGGFYMAPSCGPLHVQWHLNSFDGVLSADAFGIVVTLFALCYLAERRDNERYVDSYHLLRDFISTHAEASLIWRAID